MLKSDLTQLLESSLAALEINDAKVAFSNPPNPEMGHYATNIAMAIAKQQRKNPMQVAQEIIDHIPENNIIKSAAALAPGFINIRVQDDILIENLYAENPAIEIGKGKTAVTDTSHPNIAKPMGIHHLLSTIIGATINNVLDYCGYKVIRDNYLGDYGTQFGKLIYAYKTWGDPATVEKDPIPELLRLYVKFHDEAEKDAVIEEAGRAEFAKLEKDDGENIKLWKWMKDLSLVEFEKTWNRLGVHFDIIHGESYYEDKMAEVIEMGKKKNIFTVGERGALVCVFPDEILPTCVVVKSDGATLYHTRDLARVLDWERLFQPDLMINVVDVAQELYFKQLFSMAEMLDLTKAKNIHISFGRMQFKDRKMSTRKGDILPLEEVLDEALQKTKELLAEKEIDFPQEELDQLAKIIGIGSVKYGILSQNRTTNIVFDWDKIISLEGNSAPYLQYTYARGKSVIGKSKDSISNAPLTTYHLPLTTSESSLITHILTFNEAIIRTNEEFRPNILTNYLYELAQKFNHFYNILPILTEDAATRSFRLKLTESVCMILRTGLDLLGIEVPERM